MEEEGTMRKFRVLLLGFLILNIVISTCPTFSVAEFDKTGLDEGKRYVWTIDKVDADNVEDLNGHNAAPLREGKQFMIDVERIVEYERFDEDRVLIEYELRDFSSEYDDEGEDTYDAIENDPENYADDLEDFFDDDADLLYAEFWLFVLPKDTENFLENLTDYFENATVDGKSIDVEYDDIDAELKYDSDGLLQDLIVEFKGDTCYELSFTETIDIPSPILIWFQQNLLWVIIGIIALIGIVVLIIVLKKRSS